jgi:putative hydroxymethylpyrimidine transport system substrate-binding protein
MIRTARLALLALLALAAALALAACSDDSSGGGTGGDATREARIVLDWFPNADHAGLYTAIDEGLLAEEGVELRPEVPSDPAAALKQVGTGRVPFAVSYEPEVLLARSQGVPVVAVASLIGTPLNSVIVRSDRDISRPRDLEGHTVGIAGLPSDEPLLDTVVASDGGDPEQVRTRSVGFNLAPALAAGRVDALVGAYWNIEAPELERRGVPVEVFRLEEYGVPSYDELVLVTSDRLAAEDPDLVAAVVRGLAAGTAAAAEDPEAAAEHVVAANPDLEAEVVVEQARLTAPLLGTGDGRSVALDPAAWAAYAEWMRGEGLLTEPLDPSEAVTTEFLPEDGG